MSNLVSPDDITLDLLIQNKKHWEEMKEMSENHRDFLLEQLETNPIWDTHRKGRIITMLYNNQNEIEQDEANLITLNEMITEYLNQ